MQIFMVKKYQLFFLCLLSFLFFTQQLLAQKQQANSTAATIQNDLQKKLTPVSEPQQLILEQIVAVVGGEVITQSDYWRESRIFLVLRADPNIADLPEEDFDNDLKKSLLESIIDAYLIFSQALRFHLTEVDNDVLEKRLQDFAHAFKTPEAYQYFLKKYDISKEKLRQSLNRLLCNERFTEERLKGRLLGNNHPSPEEYTKAMKQWIKELKNMAHVQVITQTGSLEPMLDP